MNIEPSNPRKKVLRPRDQTTVVTRAARPSVAPIKHRELDIVMIRGLNLWEIKYVGGGPVPLPLRGMYTSKRVARIAIEKYKQANG